MNTIVPKTFVPNRSQMRRALVALALLAVCCSPAAASEMTAGAAKVDITSTEHGPADGPLYVKALVLKDGDKTAAIITLDVVSIGEIGYVGNEYLPEVRARLEKKLGIKPEHVMVNTSHCHGVPCSDVADRTVQAVEQAMANLVPVRVGTGTGHEDRIMENRRLKMTNGREVDVRGAYSLPPDEEIAAVGPVDPQIGVLRFDRTDGSPLAVIYNFACHPIQGVPGGRNTSDITGFASQVIEDNLSDGTIALFVQGCGGDINPVRYKDVHTPRDAEPLGNMLGLSTLKAVRKIKTRPDDRFTMIRETLTLPRADTAQKIVELEAERERLVNSLTGTTLNLETFMQLVVKYNLSDKFPSYYVYGYLNEEQLGRDELASLDADNRRHLQAYMKNIYTMEQLTRLQTNLRLLRMHQEQNLAAGSRTIDVEMLGLRIGDFVMITFPGELTVPLGLAIKERSPHELTFVAGYTNGYIYYCPTAEQLANVGGAQEDSDCILDPAWQALFDKKVDEMLGKL